MITIKILLKDDLEEFSDEIIGFCSFKFKHRFNKTTLENSAIVCLALEDNTKIIGAVRAISDLTRHAMIVDMIVDENYRQQKIGTQLLQSIVGGLRKYDIKNIGLTTEPKIEWLPEFYKKNGFKPLSDNSVYLELDY